MQRISERVSRETRLVASMWLLSFLAEGLTRVFTASAAESLFIKSYGAAALPYVYIIGAIVIPAVGFIYIRLESRIPFAWLLAGTLIVDAVALIGLRLALTSGSPIISGILAVWFDVEWALTAIVVWGLANQVFDIRQSKRVFSIIGSGELIATVAGGFVTPLIVRIVGVAGLLWCSAAGVVAGAALIIFIVFAFAPGLRSISPDEGEGVVAKRASGQQRSYVYMIFATALLSLCAYYFVDNSFYAAAQQRYSSEDALAGFIGIFFGVAGIAGLFARLVIARWAFAAFGVLGALLILPIILLLFSGSTVAAGVAGLPLLLFWLTSGSKLFDTMCRSPLYENALLTLYQALPPQRRAWAHSIVASQIEPFSGGIAAIAMIAINRVFGFSITTFAGVIAVLAAGWIALSFILKTRYVEALSAAIIRRRLNGDVLVLDEAGIAHLRRAINGDRVEDATYALRLLDRANHPLLSEAVPVMLRSAEPLLRIEAAQLIARRGFVTARAAVHEQLAREHEPAVKGALVRALASTYDAGDVVVGIEPYVRTEELEVLRNAIVALMEYGGIEGIVIGGYRFMRALRSQLPDERRLAALVIGTLHQPQFQHALLTLLNDADPEVVDTAIGAATRFTSAPIREAVLRKLDVPALARRAATSLAAGGDEALPVLVDALDAANGDTERSLRLVNIIARVKTPRAYELLEERLSGAGEMLLHATLRALRRGNYVSPPSRRGIYHALLARDAADAAWLLGAASDLEGDASTDLVTTAIDHAIARHQERVFTIASLLTSNAAVRDAYEHFQRGPELKRAYALEVIEDVVPHSLHDLVFPLLEGGSYEQRQRRVSHRPHARLSRDARFREMLADNARPGASTWLQACILHTIGTLHSVALLDCVRSAVASTDLLVAETARWAEQRLNHDRNHEGVIAMSSTIEKVLILRTVDIFQSLSDEDLVDIARRVEEVEVSAGERIITEGELGTALYIVVHGAVRVHRGNATITVLGASEIFGELTALDPEPRSADVTAEEEAVLFKLEHQDLDDIMASDLEVSRSVIKMLCRRVRASTARAVAAATLAG